jgi:hypothetical protein
MLKIAMSQAVKAQVPKPPAHLVQTKPRALITSPSGKQMAHLYTAFLSVYVTQISTWPWFTGTIDMRMRSSLKLGDDTRNGVEH